MSAMELKASFTLLSLLISVSVISACAPVGAVVPEKSLRQVREELFFDQPPETFDQFLSHSKSRTSSQSSGQGAATGDASADSGQISSAQVSNKQSNNQGTSVQSSSIGNGSGKNIKLTGTVSAGGDGSFQQMSENIAGSGFRASRRRPVIQRVTAPPVVVQVVPDTPPPAVFTRKVRPRVTTSTPFTIDFGSTDGVVVIAAPVPSGQSSSLAETFGQNTGVVQTGNIKSTGQGAATGDATADTGKNIQSQQISNVLTNNDGTAVQTGSRASGEGSNLRLAGSSQAKSNGTSQSTQDMVAVRTSTGDIIFLPAASLQNARNRKLLQQSNNILTAQQRKSLKSKGNAVAVGNALVDNGSGISNQDSGVLTNSQGTQAQGSSFGQGNGNNVAVNGAAHAESGGHATDQSGFIGAENSEGVVELQRGGSMWRKPGTAEQGQVDNTGTSKGSGAAAGTANVNNGEGTSLQNVQSNTNAFGTDVQSSSMSKGTGRGIKLSGSVTSGGQQNSGSGANRVVFRGPVNFQVPLRNMWSFGF